MQLKHPAPNGNTSRGPNENFCRLFAMCEVYHEFPTPTYNFSNLSVARLGAQCDIVVVVVMVVVVGWLLLSCRCR